MGGIVVSNVSKVINLKAIHNTLLEEMLQEIVVSNVSKVINLKAIHNIYLSALLQADVVSNVSKVINLKAIHNIAPFHKKKLKVVSNVSKVINLKAIHNKAGDSVYTEDCCFQCVKGNKFESDSQQIQDGIVLLGKLFPMCQR